MDIRRDKTQARELSWRKKVISIWWLLSLGVMGRGSSSASGLTIGEEDLDKERDLESSEEKEVQEETSGVRKVTQDEWSGDSRGLGGG